LLTRSTESAVNRHGIVGENHQDVMRPNQAKRSADSLTLGWRVNYQRWNVVLPDSPTE
jgi:hypothetical protein